MRNTILLLFIFSLSVNGYGQETETPVQNNYTVEYKLGKKYRHKEKISVGLWPLTTFDNRSFFKYETQESSSVFYPDIGRSMEAANFYELDEESLKLTHVKDLDLSYQLYTVSDFRTEFNTMSLDDQWIYNPYNRAPKPLLDIDTIDLFCYKDNRRYGDTIILTLRKEKFAAKSRGFASDIKTNKGVYYIHTGVDDDFMKLYFISIDEKQQRLVTKEQIIYYSDLGFEYESISLLSCYDENGTFNGRPYITLGFNLDEDKRLGISTVFFDLENETFEIKSSLVLPEGEFIEDFNQMKIMRQSEEEELSYFIRLVRGKTTQGDQTNTPLDYGSSEDIIMISYNDSSEKVRYFKNAAYGLEHVFKQGDNFVFLYSGKTHQTEFSDTKDNSAKGSYNYDIVFFQGETKTLYRQPIYEKGTVEEHISYGSFYYNLNQVISEGIVFYIHFGGDYMSSEKDYRFAKVTFGNH